MAGTWTQLTNQPTFAASTMLLLTDGTVMCQQSGASNWWKLTPDDTGDYVNGTWNALSPMPNAPLYYASAVLRDGRVFCAGGEYNNFVPNADLLVAEIYDPLTNAWTTLGTPAGWDKIGDAPCCLLPNGRVLLGAIDSTKTAIYDPAANTWTVAGTKDDASSEETWTLLPDGTILTVECTNVGKAEKYLPAQDKWVSAGNTPVTLPQSCPGLVAEIGPALLLPNGRVFAIGATGHTALYTPPAVINQPGAWNAGPDFKDINGNLMYAMDAPACLLPNGKVLCTVGPAPPCSYPAPTTFFEYDGTALKQIAGPSNASGQPYVGRMLLLPTGQVLYAAASQSISVYTPDGVPQDAWRPTITTCPNHLYVGQTYTLNGRQLNGLSQANSYGDDATMATNYPLVRVRHSNGKTYYCRTANHSTMAVATGTAIESTEFTVGCIPDGSGLLFVVANGIASKPVEVVIGGQKQPVRVPITEGLVQVLIGSLADGPLWALTPHGPVPIGPWGPFQPKLVQRAQSIRSSLLAVIKQSIQLGEDVLTLQQTRERQNPTPNLEPTLKGTSAKRSSK